MLKGEFMNNELQDNPTLFLVGKYWSGKIPNVVWEFMGIFSSKDIALEVCKDEYYFIAPVNLDTTVPEKTMEFPGIEWPLR